MDGIGKQLLSRAARSLDEYGAVAFGDIRKDLKDLLDGVILADDILECILLPQLLSQFLNGREVPECLNPSYYPPLFVSQDRGADTDGDLLAVLVYDVYGQIDDFLSRIDRLLQGTVGLADIGPEDIEAVMP